MPVQLKKVSLAVAVSAAMVLAGCESSLDRIDSGGVLLQISDFGTLPVTHSLSNPGTAGSLLQIDSITVQAVPKVIGGTTSTLMDVNIESYEVTYRRRDGGTRVPRPLIERIFGTAPVGGSQEYNNLPMLAPDQLFSDPLRDLGLDGIDSETGSAVIDMDIQLRFFGRTRAGDAVTSNQVAFTVKFVQ